MSKRNCQIKIGKQEIEKIAGLSYLGSMTDVQGRYRHRYERRYWQTETSIYFTEAYMEF